jgi:NADH-quinone oxidoreductase subunit F
MSLGRDFTLDSLLTDGYQAVILAVGAHRSRPLGIEGEHAQGVYPGTAFLREIALGRPPDLSGKVVGVVGGGDVAIDAARSAWRLGAREVHLIYRRERSQMPAYDDQVQAAEEEGVIFHFLTTPLRVILGPGSGDESDTRVASLECQRQVLGEFDQAGRRTPVPKGSSFTVPLDALIAAVGQETDLVSTEGLACYPDGAVAVNEGYATSREGVFAAGDAVTGPGTVVSAVAQGNEVAHCVDRYLRTGQAERLVTLPAYETVPAGWDPAEYADATRPPVVAIPITARGGNFDEVEQGWDEETVQAECRRCLRCDLEWLVQMGLSAEASPERAVG